MGAGKKKVGITHVNSAQMSLDSTLPGTLKIHSTTKKIYPFVQQTVNIMMKQTESLPSWTHSPALGNLTTTHNSNTSIHLLTLSELKVADLKRCLWPMWGCQGELGWSFFKKQLHNFDLLILHFMKCLPKTMFGVDLGRGLSGWQEAGKGPV